MQANSFKINNMFNPDKIKLDHFNGTNFTLWKDKILFLFIKLGIAYILSPNLQPITSPSGEDFEGFKDQRKEHEEDEVYCRDFILNSLSNGMYD